ncbi:MAG: alpha/beta hydrolase family protein [Streptosporangiaceae bacterium]
MTAARWDTHQPIFVDDVEGSARPAAYYLAESRDGLYVPYVLRTPADRGRFPFVFLAYGNGGGGIGWLREWVHTRPYIMERLLAAGYACGWGRYRTEVDLGFNRGGPLMVDGRQGMEVMNRSPLEFEDELAILEHVRQHPQVDPGNLGHVGVSHAGEMLFKLAFRYPGMLRAGVASEPANHEFLDLRLGDAAPVNPGTGLRDIEEMQMQDPEWVRSHTNLPLARERIAPIDLPVRHGPGQRSSAGDLPGQLRAARSGRQGRRVGVLGSPAARLYPPAGRWGRASGPDPGARHRRHHRVPRPAHEAGPATRWRPVTGAAVSGRCWAPLSAGRECAGRRG